MNETKKTKILRVGGIAVVTDYCCCWPKRTLEVAQAWYLLGYNLPLSKTMLDSLWSTVCNMRNELSSGRFKIVFSGVCARLCHRLLLALLSVCQISYGHAVPLKWEKLWSLSEITCRFLSSVLTFVPNDLPHAWIYSVVMTLIAKCTGSNEPKCHSFPGANICSSVVYSLRCISQKRKNQLPGKQWLYGTLVYGSPPTSQNTLNTAYTFFFK